MRGPARREVGSLSLLTPPHPLPRLLPGCVETLRCWKLGFFNPSPEWARGVLKHSEFGSARDLKKLDGWGPDYCVRGVFRNPAAGLEGVAVLVDKARGASADGWAMWEA